MQIILDPLESCPKDFVADLLVEAVEKKKGEQIRTTRSRPVLQEKSLLVGQVFESNEQNLQTLVGLAIACGCKDAKAVKDFLIQNGVKIIGFPLDTELGRQAIEIILEERGNNGNV